MQASPCVVAARCVMSLTPREWVPFFSFPLLPPQVVFCNSVASGALILGGLFFGDPWLGTCSAISLVVRRLHRTSPPLLC